jgi:hypothetical protein
MAHLPIGKTAYLAENQPTSRTRSVWEDSWDSPWMHLGPDTAELAIRTEAAHLETSWAGIHCYTLVEAKNLRSFLDIEE